MAPVASSPVITWNCCFFFNLVLTREAKGEGGVEGRGEERRKEGKNGVGEEVKAGDEVLICSCR